MFHVRSRHSHNNGIVVSAHTTKPPMNSRDFHGGRPFKIDASTKTDLKRLLRHLGVSMLGVLTVPIWYIAWVKIDDFLTGSVACESLNRTKYWKITIHSWERTTRKTGKADWRGINPGNPETYTVLLPYSAVSNIDFVSLRGDILTAMIWDDCLVSWRTNSSEQSAQKIARSRTLQEFSKPQSTPAPPPAPHR